MNIRTTTPKEQMLKKIRQALLQRRDNPYPNFEDTPLFKAIEQDIDVTFAENLVASGGHFLYCDTELALLENLIHVVEQRHLKKLFVWERGLQNLLQQYGFPIETTEETFQEADAAIVSCEVLIARQGAVLLSNANASGRRLIAYPEVQIVIAKTSQLVGEMRDALRFVEAKYSSSRMPSALSIIKGGRAEHNPIKGNKELFVLLLEDRI